MCVCIFIYIYIRTHKERNNELTFLHKKTTLNTARKDARVLNYLKYQLLSTIRLYDHAPYFAARCSGEQLVHRPTLLLFHG